MTIEMSDSEKWWRREADRVSRRVNAGWFFHQMAPFLIWGGLTLTVLILVVRTVRPDEANPVFAGMLLAGYLAVVVPVSFAMARRHFISWQEGMVRLEDRLRLNNALTAAGRGLGEWPPLPGRKQIQASAGLEWNRRALWLPVFAMTVMVAASIVVPIPDLGASQKPVPSNEPMAWGQMEDWISELDEEQLLDEAVLDELQEKIDELRAAPEEEWFGHSSMEATDSLKESFGKSLEDIAANLQALDRNLSVLEKFSGEMSADARDQLTREYADALRDLGLNNLKLDPELMKQLERMDLAQLSSPPMDSMTKEQLEQLKERLESGGQ